MISGFTFIRNGIRFDYPFLESLRSLLPAVDELVINVGKGEDQTLEAIQNFALQEGHGKIRFFESLWSIPNQHTPLNGAILSEQTNLALDQCKEDWCFYLQADEILHEEDLPKIKSTLERIKHLDSHSECSIEGLLFDYFHFYGSYDILQTSRSSYRREVRMLRQSSGARSMGDAQSFRKPDGTKLNVIHSGARIFHYGWVRPPQSMKEKTFFMDELYHGPSQNKDSKIKIPFTGDNYRYKRIWGLKKFNGIHPVVMRERILKKNWHWSPETEPAEWTWKDIPKITLDLLERATRYRLFEYRSYRLIAPPPLATSLPNPPPVPRPKATLILATFNMPRYLELVLTALNRQSNREFEIILCDDGSDELTLKIIENFKKNSHLSLRHLWQEHQGFRKCRMLNQAIRHAKGAVLIFLDGDCIPHRHFIKDHLGEQEDGCYLAGRRMDLGPQLSAQITREDIQRDFFNFPRASLLFSILKGETNHPQRSIRLPWHALRKLLKMDRIDDLKGCNFSVSKKAMEEINGFDESYAGYGREDTDVELRLQNLGLRIKSLKGLALQFHLWHKKREFTPSNDERLEKVRKSKIIRCESGLTPI